MGNYQPQYLGEIDLSEDTLAHYGVKGMKWRHRKLPSRKEYQLRRISGLYKQSESKYSDGSTDFARRNRSIKDTSLSGRPGRTRRYVRGVNEGTETVSEPVIRKRKRGRQL